MAAGRVPKQHSSWIYKLHDKKPSCKPDIVRVAVGTEGLAAGNE